MSRETPYEPIHPPRKHVSQARMQEILAKHSKPTPAPIEAAAVPDLLPQVLKPVPALPPAAAPAVEVMPATDSRLHWRKVSGHVMQSICQTYQILRTTVGNTMSGGWNKSDGRAVYECWARTGYLHYARLGPYQPSFAAAKEQCEAHARDALFLKSSHCAAPQQE